MKPQRSNSKSKSQSVTARYIIKRRPQSSGTDQPLYRQIGCVISNALNTGPNHQRLLSTLAVKDDLTLSQIAQQHKILYISGKNKPRPNKEHPQTSNITNKLKQYQQLLVKIKQTRSKMNTAVSTRPSTPQLTSSPQSLGVDSYYSNLVQGGGLANIKVRSISIRR